MKATEALIAAAMVGLDADVVDFLVACLDELGREPAVSDIAEVLSPFASELGVPPDRAEALSSDLARALQNAEAEPEPMLKLGLEPEPEPEPELQPEPQSAPKPVAQPEPEPQRSKPSASNAAADARRGKREEKQTRTPQPLEVQPRQQRRQRTDQVQPKQQRQHPQRQSTQQHRQLRTRPQQRLDDDRCQTAVQQPHTSMPDQRAAPAPTQSEQLGKGSTVRADDVAEEAATLLRNGSLSQEQQRIWRTLCDAVATATPSPRQAKAGPPDASELEAMRSARQARDSFVAGLSDEQQRDVQRLLDCEKRERKLRLKEEASEFKLKRSGGDTAATDATNAGQRALYGASPVLTEQQKVVMTRAFWLYEQDRREQRHSSSGSSGGIDSTEWKRMRALGGASPVLCSYLKRAGWDPAWRWPEPEGRLLRREGQQAALARYSRRR